MADANPVSDTQVLLQSMLQRLKLQPKTESTHMQDEVQFGRAELKQNGGASGSPPQTALMYNLDFYMDNKAIATNLAGPPSAGPTGVASTLSPGFAKEIDIHNPRMPLRPKQSALSWDYKSNATVSEENPDVTTHANDGVMPKQPRQHKFSLKKSGNSVSSLQSIEQMFSSTSTSGQVEESHVQSQGVGQKKWTQKVKEKWKERHKSSIKKDDSEGLEQNMANSIISPIPVQSVLHENNRTATFNEEVKIQDQTINNGSVENIPSLLDHMSETLFSPGSFNLMDEIFSGQEWARFLPSSTDSQSASSFITRDQETGLRSNISQLPRNEQNLLSQWNSREKTGTNLGITQSQLNSGGFHNMGTTENIFNQRKTQSFSQISHNSQYGLSDSESSHLQSMDLSVNPMGNDHPFKEQTQIHPYNQSNNTEPNVSSSISSEQNGNHSQTMEINHDQHGSAHEVLPDLDLSYHQPKDSSFLKKQVLLRRKRSHSTERSDSTEQWRWRNNSFSSTSDAAQSLSPASSTSSLQYSVSQDSQDSFLATETVIKKRRVDNTRHVRFAEEVTIVPPLYLSDDEDDAEDDEDYGHNAVMITELNDKGEEESPSRPSVPRWIEALRSKTKKPKIKLPRMRTKKYRFV